MGGRLLTYESVQSHCGQLKDWLKTKFRQCPPSTGTITFRNLMVLKNPLATTLQGFNPNVLWDTSYVCPRTHVKLPEKLQNQDNFSTLIKQWLLWKLYERLKNALSEPLKRKKWLKSVTRFLHEVVPWLTKALLQDAPFWMNTFPRNPAAAQYFKLQMSRRSKANDIIFGENYCQY